MNIASREDIVVAKRVALDKRPGSIIYSHTGKQLNEMDRTVAYGDHVSLSHGCLTIRVRITVARNDAMYEGEIVSLIPPANDFTDDQVSDVIVFAHDDIWLIERDV